MYQMGVKPQNNTLKCAPLVHRSYKLQCFKFNKFSDIKILDTP